MGSDNTETAAGEDVGRTEANVNELAADDSATLHEAIYNDRRLTTRNIVRWIDQVLNTLLVFHKSYTTVGEFGINDVKLGPDSSLASSRAFSDHLLSKLKTGHDALNALNFKDSSKKKNETQPSDRNVCLDFLQRLSSVHASEGKTPGEQGTSAVRAGSPERRRKRLPRGFDCQTITQFDARNDNNLSIPKEHRLHNSIAEHYHEYVHNVCMDYRCLAIVILQIYTLSVFSDDERSKIMFFQPPPEAPAEETEDEEVEKKGRNAATAPAPDAKTAARDATRRSSSAGATSGAQALAPPAPKNRTISPSKGKEIASAAPSKATTAAPVPAAGATETKKRKHRANLRSALELALLPSYPCIERMPLEVKDLLLKVCFKRPSDVLEEIVTKVRGEVCTKFEFVLLKYAKECKEALHELVLQSQESAHHETPEIWTPADERARIAAQRERQAKYAVLAQEGPRNAQARLKHEKYLLWYSMQSDQYKGKLEQRLKARRRAERNILMRRKYIYQASFHRWSMINFTAWIQEALLDYCHMLQELRLAAQQEKKKSDKNPAVYVTRLINDLLSVFTKTVITKLTAFRDKRAEQDSVGWENTITFVKPQTSLSRKHPRGMRSSKSAKIIGGSSIKSIIPSLESMRLQDGDSQENSLNGSRFGGSFADDDASVDSWQSDASSSRPAPTSQHPSHKSPQQQLKKGSTLPNINKPKLTAAQSRNLKKKEETFVPKPLTAEEVLMQCFDIVAAHLARILTHNQKNPFDLTRNMRDTVKQQKKDSEAAEADRILITSEEQLYFKRIAAQAAYFTSFTRHLRSSVVEFCDLIELVDRGWVKFMVYLTSCSVMHHYNRDEKNRLKGENYATDRLIAFFRGIVVRNIVKRVWQRTYQLHPYIPSPISSRAPSMRGSPHLSITPSPSASFRKHMMPSSADNMGLGVRSTDTHDSGTSRGHSQKEKKHVKHVVPTPEAAPSHSKGPAAPLQFRKPIYVKDLQVTSAVTANIDFSVSLDCGDHAVQAHLKHKHLQRLAQRFNLWKNITCVAYIETEIPTPDAKETEGLKEDASATRLLADSGLYTSGALPPASSHNKVHIRPVEQPINRTLVVRLVNHRDQHTDHVPSDANGVKRVAVKAELVLLTGNHHDHDLESIASDGLLSKSTYKSVVGMSYKHSSIVAQEKKQLAALALWADPTTAAGGASTSSGSHDPSAPPVVVHYRIELDDLRSYSCYAVQLVLDKSLTEDLKEGNKSFFHSLHQAEDYDNHSLGSVESLDELDFADVGKLWSIQECERPPASPNEHNFASLSAPPPVTATHGLQVQLTHYVATRPGIPRTVKALTGKVTYHSTDAPKSLSSGTDAPGVSTATSLVQFLPHKTPGGSLSGSSLHHHLECVAALQSCIELHWAQSEDDLHNHTHYEVQRRLLLVNTVPPVKLQLPPSRRKLSSAERRAKRRNKKEEPVSAVVSAEAAPFEEAVYVGPWKHAAGLNSALKDKTHNQFSNQNKNGIVLFPHHPTFCTDRVALPAELDANPDAYNSVMGYLCATFPDMVLRAAGNQASAQVVADNNDEQDDQDGSSSAPVLSDDKLLDTMVESGLSIGYEYRVRAVNSVGAGKFNATSSYIPLQHSTTTGQSHPHKVCTVQLAQVCTHLAQLCDFRGNHPKYRSHNTQLVQTVLIEQTERLQQLSEAKVRSGDPFVEHIVGLKDKSTARTADAGAGDEANETMPETSENRDGKLAEDGLADWLMSLQNECPL